MRNSPKKNCRKSNVKNRSLSTVTAKNKLSRFTPRPRIAGNEIEKVIRAKLPTFARKYSTRNNQQNNRSSKKEEESDCEIIEIKPTPIIVIDDDNDHDPNRTIETICLDKTIEANTEPLFFIDTQPNSCKISETPIYEIDQTPSTSMIDVNASQIVISTDTSFESSPFSSNRSNICSEKPSNSKSIDTDNVSNMNLHISIQSNDSSSGASRIITRSTPVNKNLENQQNIENNNYNSNSNNISNQRTAVKRKAHEENENGEVATKRSNVVVLNNTLSDDESCVFVSETMTQDLRKKISGSMLRKDFIPLPGNSTKSQAKKSNIGRKKSVRAQRRSEKRKRGGNGNYIQFIEQLQRSNEVSLFTKQNTVPSANNKRTHTVTSNDVRPTRTITSRRLAGDKFQEFENERTLFKTNPDLFEKRMIIIDGSNIAYKYVFIFNFNSSMFFNELIFLFRTLTFN